MPAPEREPDLYDHTIELGRSLKAVSDRDPDGKPSSTAATAFRSWLNTVSGSNREPAYFEDVAENYDVEANSNRDLFTLFEMLHPYVDMPDYEEEPAGTFIGLPMV
jgi:hypothetical protein